jgi:anti-sigma regulatory factor (Ser/Thr protein kinase)
VRQQDIAISAHAAVKARRLVAEACKDAATPDGLNSALLITTELVTNAVRHSGMGEGDTLMLVVDLSLGRAIISVRDRGPGFSPSGLEPPSADAGTGWGLRVVEALSTAWGVRQEAEGFSVWAEVRFQGLGGQTIASSP